MIFNYQLIFKRKYVILAMVIDCGNNRYIKANKNIHELWNI